MYVPLYRTKGLTSVLLSLLSPQLTWTALSTSRHVHLTDATQAQEAVVSYLPLSHIAAQMVDIWVTMRVGGATYFAQPDALKVSQRSGHPDVDYCLKKRIDGGFHKRAYLVIEALK